MNAPEHLCESIARRVLFDHRRGHTTSQAAINFIERTCSCDVCAKKRAHRRNTDGRIQKP